MLTKTLGNNFFRTMAIKKFLCLATMALMTSVVFAQTIKDANQLFEQGNYQEAKTLYYRFKSNNSTAAKRYSLCSKLDGYYSTALDYYNERKYISALKICDKIFESNPICAKTRKLQNDCQTAIRELQEERQRKFDDARDSQLESKLVAFQQEYSKQQEWVDKTQIVIEDLKVYEKAKVQDTRESYVVYLSESKYKIYEKEAIYKIKEFDCHTMWEAIKNVRDKSQFEKYITLYSEYNYHVDAAKANISLLEAEDFSDRQKWEEAYLKFSSSVGHTSIPFTKDDEKMYKTATMVHDYLALGSDASESELISYMDANKKSPYYDNASERVAKLRIKKIKEDADDPSKTMKNLRSDYRAASKYVVNPATKELLETVRTQSYAKKREWNKDMYGPIITFGIGLNGAFSNNVFDLGIGTYVRFGRFNHVVNATIGLKYELMSQYKGTIKTSSSKQNNHSFVAHSAILPVGLRINCLRLSDDWSMFIGGKAEFGINFKGDLLVPDTDKEIGEVMKKYTISYYPEIGFQSRHWDFNLYYKMSHDPYQSESKNPYIPFVDEKTLKSKNFFGINVAYYF